MKWFISRELDKTHLFAKIQRPEEDEEDGDGDADAEGPIELAEGDGATVQIPRMQRQRELSGQLSEV